MSDGNRLTKEIAEQFLADEDSVDLSEFSAIDDDAAEVLIKHDGGLDLGGLTSLSDNVANILSNALGTLCLDGIPAVSDAQASTLGLFMGEELQLLGLTSISEEAVLALAVNDRVCIDVLPDGWDGRIPKSMPGTANEFKLAQSLCHCDETGAPYLRGPRAGVPLFGELALEEAEKLCRYEGTDVCLNGWYSVESPLVLQHLSNAKFQSINFRLEEVTTEAAKILAECQSASLGIESEVIDEEAADILLAYKGRFIGMPRVKSVFKWAGCHEIFDTHQSMQHWGQVEAFPARIKLTGQCFVCGHVYEASVPVQHILNAPSGTLGGLLEIDEDLMVSLPGGNFFGERVCSTCSESLAE